ncbi:MAG: SIR2 family protein [Zavarzinella sp.]
MKNRKSLSGDLIGVGEFITRELTNDRSGIFGKWLVEVFDTVNNVDNSVINSLANLDINIATTNYDGVIEKALNLHAITWKDVASATEFLRNRSRAILHLHGHYKTPETVILGASSYSQICNDVHFQEKLRATLLFKTVIFVGCGIDGLSDPNFGSLFDWAQDALEQCSHQHYVLVKESELTIWQQRLRGIPVKAVSYGSTHSELASFLTQLGSNVRKKIVVDPLARLNDVQLSYETMWPLLENKLGIQGSRALLSESMQLAKSLMDAGGKLRAALDFHSRLNKYKKTLLNNDYLEFALFSAESLLNIEPRLTYTIIEEIRSVFKGSILPGKYFSKLADLSIRCLDALCAYSETLIQIDIALEATDGDENERLQAERAEITFLQGDFLNGY